MSSLNPLVSLTKNTKQKQYNREMNFEIIAYHPQQKESLDYTNKQLRVTKYA